MRRVLVLLVSVAMVAPALPAPGSAHGDEAAKVDPSLEEAQGEVPTIVSFRGPAPAGVVDRLAAEGTIHTVYSIIDAAHVTVPVDRLDAVAGIEQVTRVDRDHALELHLDTSKPVVGVTPQLWSDGYDGDGTTIAVVDTGIDSTHPGVGDRVERGVTFSGTGGGPVESDASVDTDGHGTHVGAITGGNGATSQLLDPDDEQYAGMSPQVGLVSLDISQSFTTSTAIRAFEWVHNNHEEYDISVVQNSWGRVETGQAYDPRDPAVRASNALVADDDLVVVFSAGNNGPGDASLSMEAQNPNVITVGATDDSGTPAQFSSRGPVIHQNGTHAAWTKPDVAAPGVQITSAASQQGNPTSGLYRALSGTSQASPHVGGIAAMMRAEAPDLTAPQVHAILERTAQDLGPEGPDADTGHGMVHAPSALEQTLGIANGTLSTNTETFSQTGTLITGTQIEGLLEDEGASTHRASGSIPVKEEALGLELSFTWSSAQAGLPTPQLRVSLEDPSGRQMLVPAEDQAAERTVSSPAEGTWSWQAEPASGTEAGAAAYEMNATVTYEDPDPLRETAGVEGGFFQDDWRRAVGQVFTDARSTFGTAPLLATLALISFAVTLMAASAIRR